MHCSGTCIYECVFAVLQQRASYFASENSDFGAAWCCLFCSQTGIITQLAVTDPDAGNRDPTKANESLKQSTIWSTQLARDSPPAKKTVGAP